MQAVKDRANQKQKPKQIKARAGSAKGTESAGLIEREQQKLNMRMNQLGEI